MYKISVSHANNNVITYIIQELYMCDELGWTTNLTGLSSCVYTGVYICLYTHVCVRLRMTTHGGMLACVVIPLWLHLQGLVMGII